MKNPLRNYISSEAGRNDGFSLVEILAVLAIMLVLAGAIVGLAKYAEGKATQSKVRMEIATIDTALQQYKLDKGTYPPDLVTLVDAGYLKNWPINRINTATGARVLASPYCAWGSGAKAKTDSISDGECYQYTNGIISVISPDYTATNRNIGPP